MKDEKDPVAENSGENTGRGRVENLRPYQWKKGQPSPNPGGRPKKAPISESYAHHVGAPLPDEIRSRLRLADGATWADAIAVTQIRSAVKGNSVAAKEIADRIEGRVTQPIAGGDGGPVEVKWTVEHLGASKEPKDDEQVEQADSQDAASIKP